MAPTRYFLIVYDRHRGLLLEDPPREFDDQDVAIEAYDEAEQEYRTDRNAEIVLVGADSLETVRQTHSNYFGGDLAKLVAGSDPLRWRETATRPPCRQSRPEFRRGARRVASPSGSTDRPPVRGTPSALSPIRDALE